jgi:hypothetical protein
MKQIDVKETLKLLTDLHYTLYEYCRHNLTGGCNVCYFGRDIKPCTKRIILKLVREYEVKSDWHDYYLRRKERTQNDKV